MLGYQPRSLSNGNVKSFGGTNNVVRSAEMEGSISWFGNALVSQCETLEPGWSGLGVKSSGRFNASAPASRFGFVVKLAETLPGVLREP